MDFIVDDTNINTSFETMAKELLLNHVIRVNDVELEITEIEFYYFKTGIHEDNYTHKHDLDAGCWRLHRSGLDITFQSADDQDGGVLIRGIKDQKEGLINGPLNVFSFILAQMGPTINPNFLQLQKAVLPVTEIIKTHRYLPNKTEYADYKLKPYRFMKYFDSVNKLKPTDKESIVSNHTVVG